VSEDASEAHFWREVETAFSAVLDAGDAARTEALDRHCGRDAAVRQEVEALLTAHAEAGEFIDTARFGPLGTILDDVSTDTLIDARIGAFRIEKRIGEGGMGAVYLAHRVTGDFSQRVAVKLIASRLYGKDTLRRFVGERHVFSNRQGVEQLHALEGAAQAAPGPLRR